MFFSQVFYPFLSLFYLPFIIFFSISTLYLLVFSTYNVLSCLSSNSYLSNLHLRPLPPCFFTFNVLSCLSSTSHLSNLLYLHISSNSHLSNLLHLHPLPPCLFPPRMQCPLLSLFYLPYLFAYLPLPSLYRRPLSPPRVF